MQRLVYYVDAATATLRAVDPSRVERFRTAVESFLDAPRSAFAKPLSPNVHQLKHRGAKMRGFGTRCRDGSRDVLVVQTVYRKRNEEKYFDRLDDYDEEGRQFKDRFRKLGDDEFEAWRRSARASDEVILVGP